MLEVIIQKMKYLQYISFLESSSNTTSYIKRTANPMKVAKIYTTLMTHKYRGS
jgi:hypothetical protein